jgi:hypothetical protein
MHKTITFHKAFTPLYLSAIVLLFVWSWRPAYAADQTPPCAREIATYCKGVKPGGGRLLNCLKEHKKDLSATCVKKVSTVDKKVKEAQEACSEDIGKFCKDVRPGEGRIIRCLREHAQEISSGCSEKIESAKQMIPTGKTPDR